MSERYYKENNDLRRDIDDLRIKNSIKDNELSDVLKVKGTYIY